MSLPSITGKQIRPIVFSLLLLNTPNFNSYIRLICCSLSELVLECVNE